jgi:hypothetical protein
MNVIFDSAERDRQSDSHLPVRVTRSNHARNLLLTRGQRVKGGMSPGLYDGDDPVIGCIDSHVSSNIVHLGEFAQWQFAWGGTHSRDQPVDRFGDVVDHSTRLLEENST